MKHAFLRAAESVRKIKAQFVGQDVWSGPGALSVPDQTPIADVSFFLPGGAQAVLLIHGLTGTPTEMRFIGKALNQAGYTVYGMQLAGHCGSEAHLLHTRRHDWVASVEAAFARLAEKHDQIFAAGLSMGAVLALTLAARHPPQLKGIALYSTTLVYDGWTVPRLRFLLPLFLYTPLGERYRFVETFPYGIKDTRLRARVIQSMQSGDSASAGNLGMAGRSLRELRALVRETKRVIPQVKIPALVIHSREDDVSSVSNAHYLCRHLGGPTEKVLLNNCYHMITVDQERQRVAAETVAFFQRICPPEPGQAAASPPARARRHSAQVG